MNPNLPENTFDENLFDFCQELLRLNGQIREGNFQSLAGAAAPLLRKTVSEAFTTNSSFPDLHAFIKEINLKGQGPLKDHFPLFLEGAHVTKKHSDELFSDYLTTLDHGLRENPGHPRGEFFTALQALAPCSEKIIADFFVSVRHLADTKNFSHWPEFYKATLVLSSLSEFLIPFFNALRIVPSYLHKAQSRANLIKNLSLYPRFSFFDIYTPAQLQRRKWLIDELLNARGRQWGTVFLLKGFTGTLAQMIFDREEIQVEKIRSFDSDEEAGKMAERFNAPQVQDSWKFKSVGMDLRNMQFPCHYFVKRNDGSLCELYDSPDLVIHLNTEPEDHLSDWWSKIQPGTWVALQFNTTTTITDANKSLAKQEDLKRRFLLSDFKFSGSLDSTFFMIIGQK